MSTGVKRFSTPKKHLMDINQRSNRAQGEEEEEREDLNDQDWFVPSEECDVVIGEDVLRMDPNDEDFNYHCPIKDGDLNLHQGIGGSKTAALVDLEAIILYAIESKLGIPKADLPNYRAVFIIPAMYRRDLPKHYITMMLTNLGFGGCFVLQVSDR